MLKSASFLATLEALPAMIQWIEECLLKLPFPDIWKVKLALEEAIVNIIHHAYQKQKGKVDLMFSRDSKKIQFILKDQGLPFDPLKDPTSSSKKEEGGLGILLMREYMDEIYYQRDDSYNCLTLVKRATFSSL